MKKIILNSEVNFDFKARVGWNGVGGQHGNRHFQARGGVLVAESDLLAKCAE